MAVSTDPTDPHFGLESDPTNPNFGLAPTPAPAAPAAVDTPSVAEQYGTGGDPTEVIKKFLDTPSAAKNALEAAAETIKGFVPASLKQAAEMATPLTGAIENLVQTPQKLSDVLFGGKTVAQAFPESQTLVEAEKTPPFSKERFQAGFGIASQLGMAALLSKQIAPNEPAPLQEALGFKSPPEQPGAPAAPLTDVVTNGQDIKPVVESIKPVEATQPTEIQPQEVIPNAIQEPSTSGVVPQPRETTPETGGVSQGVGPSEQGQEVAKTGATEEAVAQPIIAYHGSRSEFEKFRPTTGDIGFHFGSPEQADWRVGDEGTVKPYHLDIKNPLRLNRDPGGWYGEDAVNLVNEAIGSKLNPSASTSSIRQAIQKAGYDGVIYPNKFEGQGDSYIAFSPDQIAPAPKPPTAQPEAPAATLPPPAPETQPGGTTEAAAGTVESPAVPKTEEAAKSVPAPGETEKPPVQTATEQATGISTERLQSIYGKDSVLITKGRSPEQFQAIGQADTRDPYAVLSKSQQTGIALPDDVPVLRVEHQRLLEKARAAYGTPEYNGLAQQAADFANATKQVAHGPASDIMRSLQDVDKPSYNSPADFDNIVRERMNRESTPEEQQTFQKAADEVKNGEQDMSKSASDAQARVSRYQPKETMSFEDAVDNLKKQIAELTGPCT
jgi:hypothetical protein